jgi:putative ABC transport system permease protein
MTTLKLLLAEILYRKLNFTLSLLAVIIAVTLFVAGPILVDAYSRQTDAKLAQLEDETRKLMKNMGFNLMIVHRDNDMTDFWSGDFAKYDMPQDYVERLARDPRLTLVTHLVATLQKRIDFGGRKVLLQGYMPETPQSHAPQTEFAKKLAEKKAPMGYEVEQGTVQLGHELRGDYKVGDTIDVLGKQFTIAALLPEKGSKEDITIVMHLSDAQEILGLPGKINQIMALECHCAEAALPLIRQQLSDVLPEARVTEFQSIALARAEQRLQVADSRADIEGTLRTLVNVVTPIIVLACAIWVGLLALVNVRERRTEIGLLRALGKGSGMIASLFLGKAALLGFVGGAIGFALGSGLAAWLGVEALDVGRSVLALRYDVLVLALFGAPLLSALASYLPTLAALTQDPAVVLREV